MSDTHKNVLGMQLNSHTSAEENNTNNSDSSKKIIESNEIARTHFTAVKVEDKGWFLAFGRNRLSEFFNTEVEVKMYLDKHQWEVITNLICLIVNKFEEKENP